MDKEFKAFNHGIDKINIQYKKIVELRPTEIHLKEDGSLENEPSIAIVMTHPLVENKELAVVGQLSLKMFNDGLNELGYEIVKKQNNG